MAGIRYVTISKFAELSGYTEDAIRTKIRDSVWVEGYEWHKAPDCRNLIDIEGVERWIVNARASDKFLAPATR